MKNLLFYIFLYCNTDIIFNKIYLSSYSTIDNELIQHNEQFYTSIITQNIFALSVYTMYLFKNFITYKEIHKSSMALAFVYIKYTLNSVLNDTMTISQFESNRNIMWLFARPLMLQMYCNINNLTLQEINIQYHIIPVVINIFMYPYKKTEFFYWFSGFATLLILYFIKTLYTKRNLIFTNIFLFIWFIFICLNIIELFQMTDKYTINIYYSYADMISKMMTSIIVNDYNEKELAQLKGMDLQSVQFVSYMIQSINKYKKETAIITLQCNNFISFTMQSFLAKIPQNKVSLEKELLKKLLPFNLDREYIANSNSNSNAISNSNSKHFNMVCVLFTDIVNYTELARSYDDNTIFQLLYTVYSSFDNIIKKYPHLQKIETIGDAYMVVGDIFSGSINHQIAVKEIILFALDIVKEIKTIKTPDNNVLSIRVGINLGNVSIGILGNEIPRLCVVGNAVNVAARLQSTADPDTIQLSKHIYEQLEDIEFDVKNEITPKENVFLKNMGSVKTYNIKP